MDLSVEVHLIQNRLYTQIYICSRINFKSALGSALGQLCPSRMCPSIGRLRLFFFVSQTFMSQYMQSRPLLSEKGSIPGTPEKLKSMETKIQTF